MTDNEARKWLVALDETDLIRIAAVPGLGASWAKRAKTNHGELVRGRQRAQKAVKAAILRDSHDFAKTLADFWDEEIAAALAELDIDDPAAYGARFAARELGTSAAKAFLACVAAADLDVSSEIAARLDELMAVAENPLPPKIEAPPIDAMAAPSGGDVETGEVETAEVETGEVETEEAETDDEIVELLERTRSLRQQGAQLADRLAAAAQAIASGRPADPLESAPDEWSASVRAHLLTFAHLAGADDLGALEATLSSLIETQATQVSDAHKALQTAEFLNQQGLADMVPDALARFGFRSLEQVELLAELGPATESEAPESEFVDAADGAPHDASDAPVEDPAVPSQTPSEPCPATSERVVEPPPVEPPPDKVTGLPDFPWDDGNPPLIAQLISEGRYALACHVAAATNLSAGRQRLLRLSCAAACCSLSALELALPQLIPDDSDIQQLHTDEIRVLLAASLHAGLRLGYPPLGFATLIDRAELADTGLAPVMQALAVAVQRGMTRENDQSAAGGEQLASRWSELADEAAELRDKLKLRTLIAQRSSRVLHQLAKESQPPGKALAIAAELTRRGIDGASSAEWADVDALGADLLDHNKRERLINNADREVTPGPQRNKLIYASARTQLHDELTGIGDFLSRLRTVRRAILNADDIKGVESAQDLDRALSQLPPDSEPRTVGDAALHRLIDWRTGGGAAQFADSVQDVLDEELLAVFEIPRDADGRPTRRPSPLEIVELLTPRDPETIVAGHLARGDIAAARTVIARHDLEGRFDDDLLRAARDTERRYDAALAAAEVGAARLRSLYQDDLARELSAQIETLRTPQADRLDLAIAMLHQISARADEQLHACHQDLMARTQAANPSDGDKARILDRLEHGDEALALDFITTIEAGQALPEVVETHGDDFTEFYPAIVDVAADAQDAGDDPLDAARRALSASSPPADRQLRDGLAGWRTIKTAQRGDRDAFRLGVAQLLRMVGLVPSSDWMKEVSRVQRSGFATYRVMALPVDRSYVPQMGTQAHGSYDITFVWDKVTPARLLDFIDDSTRTTQPNIIFYFGVLSARERVQLRSLTLPGRGKGFSPLVIDDAVVAWLTSRREPGWRFTQRVTLPFTTINPYTPFAGGEVPDEVFVGRDDERRRIESPTGPMFVYGGRQLGKSALLRKVERLFNESSPPETGQHGRVGNVAVYIDLKAAGIGEAQEPAALWPLLGERLTRAGVLPEKGARTSTAEDVTKQITRWLDAEQRNRMLLLLDESDNFLTVDANAGGSSTRGAFPVLQALKGIMESSRRRFKPVFAGLHQVQRFHDTSNTPVAHGGEDILIGPLKSQDAYSLVVDPMNALGYAFVNPELVWRLLLVTNYQASLVQIVSEALVRHLEGRSLSADGGRILIGEKDVQAVCERTDVQELIAQRFRWTINLDNRYRVIALVVALRSRSVNQPASTFSVDDLREDCETFWHQGFSRDVLSRKEFGRYLDEMVGLGVLHRQGDQFGLRSPNIVRMLGSQEALDQELEDAGRHLEPTFEYNPTMTRQIIGDYAGIWSPRSPLTDHELAQLLVPDAKHPVRVVLGTAALAVDRVAAVIRQTAEMKDIACLTNDGPEVSGLSQLHFGKPTHVVVDLTGWTGEVDLAALAHSLSGHANLTATIVTGANLLSAVTALGEPIIYLHRWSLDGLRAWSDSPFDSPLLREKLYRVTSGWPKLVESAMQLVNDGRSTDAALAELVQQLSAPDFARQLLVETAIDPSVAKRWATWFTTTSPNDGLIESEQVSVGDLSEALGRDAEPVLAELEALDLVTKDDGWVLDRVVVAAAAQNAS